MTSLDELRKEPVYFFTSVPIAPYGQGSSMRVYTNLRAYLDLGFHVDLLQIVDGKFASKPPVLPPGDIHLTQLPRRPNQMNRFAKNLSIRLGWPPAFLLNVIFPDRSEVIRQLSPRIAKNPGAICHFEYDNFASASLSFPGIRSVWSNHDLFTDRVPLIWQMRDERVAPNRLRAPRELTLKRVRQAEDLIAAHSRLILNIAEHEHHEFHTVRGYHQAVLFPMSWPDEVLVPHTHPWFQDGKLRLLHLGSVNGFVAYESLRFLLEQVFPLLAPSVLEHIELWVVGTLANSFYCNRILEIAKPYPQVRFFGFVEDLREIYAQVDLQVVGGLKASGLRTRIIESMVYGVPVLSTEEMAKGLHKLEDGQNIFLAFGAPDYAEKLAELVTAPPNFEPLALAARETYDKYYSRQVAAEILANALQKLI